MKRRMILGLLAVLPFAQAKARDPFAQQQAPQRKRVVPLDVINKYGLKTSNGYGPYVLSENGLPYDLDDIIAILFEVSKEHWQSKK